MVIFSSQYTEHYYTKVVALSTVMIWLTHTKCGTKYKFSPKSMRSQNDRGHR
jgi:hypothetical protein